MRTPLLILACLSLIVAGCTDAGSTPQAEAPRASEPSVDETTGAIEGLVADDQIQPIEGATVGAQDQDVQTVTDAEGHFVINGLQPGSYVLFAQKLGYEAAARPVMVEAGIVTQVRFMLDPLSTEEPYPLTQSYTGLIECAWGVSGAGSGNCIPLQFVFQQVGTNPTNTRIIGLFPIQNPEKVKQGVFEMTWNPSAATTGGQLLLTVELEGTGVVTGKTYGRNQGTNPVRVVTDATPFKELKPDEKKDRVQTRTFPATTNPPTFVVNQKFTVFATACYVAECPDLFTVLSDA